ncbi:MAG: YchJ family protein [Limnohabitans sp.]
MTLPAPKVCPCGGAPTTLKRKGAEVAYADCCGRVIEQDELPPDALHLMRSRYTAFVLENQAYLQRTWHADHRPETLDFEDGAKWLGLEIKDFVDTGVEDGHATAQVEFVARVRVAGKAHRLHERSRFVCEQGQWLYVEAI